MNSGLYAVEEFVNSVVDFVNSDFVLVGAPALHCIFLGRVSFVNSVAEDFMNSSFVLVYTLLFC